MKIMVIKNLTLTDGVKQIKLERMKVYNWSESKAKELIAQGYAVRFGFLNELEVSP